MKKRLLSLVKIVSILILFVPIFAFPFIMGNFIFPFIVPKILLVRSLVVVLFGAYILLLLSSYQEFRPKYNLLHIAVLGYFLSLLISTFVGVDWYNSFWDNHERMLGFFTIVHYILMYFVFSSVFKTKEEWKKLSWAFLISGALVMFVGVIQKISPQVLLNNGSPRVVATLGNAIYVAGLGLFMVFLGYLTGVQEVIKWKRNVAYAIGVLGLLGIFLSGTRGTLLAFFASVGVMLLLYFIFLKGHKKIRMTIGAIIGGGLLLLGILFAFRQTSFVSNIPALGRLLNTSISSDSADTRIMAWSIAYESWKEKPVFGWGPNNYYYAFNKYYRPEFLLYGPSETWFDNAHNVVMNTLSTQGAFGIFFYFAFFIGGIYLLIRGYKNGQVSVHLMAGGVAFFVGHFIHNIFVFENPTSYIYFFFFLAYVVFLTTKQEVVDKKSSPKTVPVALTVIVVLAAFLVLWITDINTGRANMRALRSMQYLYAGQIESGMELYRQAESFGSPHMGDIRSDFLRTSTQFVDKAARSRINNPLIEKLFFFAYDEGKKNLQSRPLDIRNHLMMAQGALVGQSFKNGQGLFTEAEAYLKLASTLSPRRQQVYYILATIELAQGKVDEATNHLKYSIDLEPKVAEGYIRLAILYSQIGKPDEARNTIALARTNQVVFAPDQLSLVSQIEASPAITSTPSTTSKK